MVSTINSPVSGRILDIDETIPFRASVLFRGLPSTEAVLSWESNIDGALGTFYSSDDIKLTEGKHTITVTAVQNNETKTDEIVLTIYDKKKNLGDKGDGKCLVANPIDVITGNKYHTETDFSTRTESPIYVKRSYNSLSDKVGLFGHGWSSNIEERVEHNTDTQQAIVIDDSGAAQRFDLVGSAWVDESSSKATLVREIGNSWTYTLFDNTIKTYNPTGQILSITRPNGLTLSYNYVAGVLDSIADEYGHSVSFTYNPDGYISGFTDPDSRQYRYEYNADNLEYMIYPDLTPGNLVDNPRKQYIYDNPNFPHALTGLIDEENIRFATWKYDEFGRALFSKHAGDKETYTLAYNHNGTTTTTNALEKETTYDYASIKGLLKVTTVEGHQSTHCMASMQSTEYDLVTGFAKIKTDWKNNQVLLEHNEFGQETSRTVVDTGEGWMPTPIDLRVTTTTQYNGVRKPWLIDKAGVHIENTYTPRGRIDLVEATDATTQTIPYSTVGQIRQTDYTYTLFLNSDVVQFVDIDGPRTDVSDTVRYEYDTRGNLIKVTNPLSQVIEYKNYNSLGLPGQMIDVNNLVTDYTYTPRGWLDTVTVHSTKGDALTDYDYYRNGLLQKVTAANGSSLTYNYNDARHLGSVVNNLGEIKDYTPNDLNGEWETIQYKEAGGVIRYEQGRLFDELGRVRGLTSPVGHSIDYTLDLSGNVKEITQAINYASEVKQRTDKKFYDAFNRLRRHEAEDAATIHYDYYDAGNLKQVKVSGGADQITEYVYNGFGDLIYESSPATGATTYYRDSAGNLERLVNADLEETINTYDKLNRLKTVVQTGTTAENVTYTYDLGINSVGRLTKISDQSGATDFYYDDQGYIDWQDYTIDAKAYTVDYTFDKAGQQLDILYPTGRKIEYQHDAIGRISSVIATGAPQGTVTLVRDIQYEPFGPIKSYSYGNDLSRTVKYDKAYRQDDITHGWLFENEVIDYRFDTADQLRALNKSIINQQTTTQVGAKQFEYDLASRLKATRWSLSDGQTLSSLSESIEYDYDLFGNRTNKRLISQKSGAGNINQAWQYTINPLNNQLDAISKANDAVNYSSTHSYSYGDTGVVDTTGLQGYSYNRKQQLTDVTESSIVKGRYLHNARGQRVRKQAAGKTIHYHYDMQGQLIAETDATNALLREYAYVGNMPIAMMGAELLYDGVPSTSTSTQLIGDRPFTVNLRNQTEANSLQAIVGDSEISARLSNTSVYEGKEKLGLTMREQADGLSGSKIDVYFSAVNVGTMDMIIVPVEKERDCSLLALLVCSPTYTIKVPIPMFGVAPGDGIMEIDITDASGTLTNEQLAITGDWVKLERAGPYINVLVSTDGVNWTTLRQINLPMLPDAYMGTLATNIKANIETSYKAANDNLFYLHTDHLNTVTAVSSNIGKHAVWQKRDFDVGASPFGLGKLASGKDTHHGVFEMPLRFPGQYYDAESGLHYNYYRDYDPSTGRYVESDPIGLKGGMNTYGYVGGNPVGNSDFYGLCSGQFGIPCEFGVWGNIEKEAKEYKKIENYEQAAKDVGGIAAGTAAVYFPVSRVAGFAAKGALQCGAKIVKNKEKIKKATQQACIAAGFAAAFCKGETLDGILRDMRTVENIRKESGSNQVPNSNVQK